MASELLNWQGQTAVVIASGPSLTRADCWDVSQAHVKTIAVNCSFRMAPWADVVYMGDLAAIRTYTGEARRLCHLTTQFWTSMADPTGHGAWHRIKGTNDVGLGKNLVYFNGNSGFQAVNLATLFGARRIILLGFDMMLGPEGQRHWHPDHPAPLVQWLAFDEWIYKSQKVASDAAAMDVDIVNCSRQTALTAFRRGDLLEELR